MQTTYFCSEEHAAMQVAMPPIYIQRTGAVLENVMMPICTPVSTLLKYVASKQGDSRLRVICLDTVPRIGNVLSDDVVVYDAASRSPDLKLMVLDLEASSGEEFVVENSEATPPRKKPREDDSSVSPSSKKAPRIRKQTSTLTKNDLRRFMFATAQQ